MSASIDIHLNNYNGTDKPVEVQFCTQRIKSNSRFSNAALCVSLGDTILTIHTHSVDTLQTFSDAIAVAIQNRRIEEPDSTPQA